jgi:virulence-associated protein E/primase-like protein
MVIAPGDPDNNPQQQAIRAAHGRASVNGRASRTLDQLFATEARWLCGERPSKKPFDPNTGGAGRNNDPSTFGTLAEAFAACNGRKLFLGIVPLSPLVIFDLDEVRNSETGEIAPFALDIVAKLGSRTEISPSGRGLHAFALCPDCTTPSKTIKWSNPHPAVKKKQGFEVMLGLGHYSTVTNDLLDGVIDVATVSQTLIEEIIGDGEEEKVRRIGQTSNPRAGNRRPPRSNGRETYGAWADAIANGPEFDYSDWIHIGYALFDAFGDDGVDLWHQISARNSKYVERTTDRVWRSIVRNGSKRISAGTLYFYATNMGGTWQPPPPPPKPRRERKPRPEPVPRTGPQSPELDPASLLSNGENIACVMDILRHHEDWRGVLAFDRFSLHVMLTKRMPRTGPQTPPDQWAPKAMRDVDCTNALGWFHKRGMTKLKIGMLHNAMTAVAQDNPFHPVFEYFDRVCAGPEPREVKSANAHLIDPDLPAADSLSLWLTLGFGAEDNLLNRAVARAFLIALVRRVRQPGCQQDHMLVLMSDDQGVHKSRGLRALVGDAWFADRMPAISTKRAGPVARQDSDRAP